MGLDPHKVTALASFAVIGQVYDGLLEINADLQLEPALASSYEISDDGLVYTFTLREGVVFHIGRPFGADDVVYSLERILDPETGSAHASRFDQAASVEAVDERTVVFTHNEPFAPFLANTPNLYVAAREVVEEHGDLQQVAVGTGPFRLVEVVPDTYLRLEANQAYDRPEQPGVARLRYNVVPEGSTRAAGLGTGTYHLLPDVDPTTAVTLRAAPSITVLEVPGPSYTLLGMNTTRPPFDDPLGRHTINLALDREELVEAVFLGNAGHPDGIAYTILTFGARRDVADTAQVVQAQLERAGMQVEVNVAAFGTFAQDWQNSDVDAFVGLNAGSIDPDGYMHRTFISGGSTNVFLYSNPEVDELLARGRTTADVATRQDIYAELQRVLACEGPVAHLNHGTLFSAHRDEAEGFQQIATGSVRYLRYATLR